MNGVSIALLLPITALGFGGVSTVAWSRWAKGRGKHGDWARVAPETLSLASRLEFLLVMGLIAVWAYLLLDGYTDPEKGIINGFSIILLIATAAGWLYLAGLGQTVDSPIFAEAAVARSRRDVGRKTASPNIFDAARRHYERNRAALENSYWGQHVAMSPDGKQAIGPTRKDAIAAFELKHGKREIATFRIGR